MFSKKNRIKSSFFKDLFKKKKKTLNSENLGLKIVENKGQINNYAVIVSKKSAKNAVDRNNAKRRVLAILNEEKTLILQGFSVVFYVKSGVFNLSHDDLRLEIVNLLKEAEIYENNN